MKIYLLKDLPGKGKAGQIVELSDGYARNFVLKGGYGRVADNATATHVKQTQEANAFHKAEEIKAIKEIIEKLRGTEIQIGIKIGANDKVFGAVTCLEIAQKLVQKGLKIDKKALVFDKISALGAHKIRVKFDHGLTGEFNLTVVGEK
jgi:large subunit ribosomal protein L9